MPKRTLHADDRPPVSTTPASPRPEATGYLAAGQPALNKITPEIPGSLSGIHRNLTVYRRTH